MYVETSELPECLQRALSSAGIGRKDIRVEAAETYTQRAPSGDGMRGFTTVVNLATGQRESIVGSWGGSNAFSPGNAADNDGAERPLPEGFAIVQGTMGYKPYACVLLNPKNFAPMIPAKPEMSDRLRMLVTIYASLNSAGRKHYFERHSSHKATEAELSELVRLGMITRTKSGAITVTAIGRNNHDGKSYY